MVEAAGRAPADTPPVPADLDWNLWLGGAPERPYHPAYHPFAWRGWFDFGTGALGDMAVHNLDPAFYALDLGRARGGRIAEQSALGKESYPAWQIITFEFAAQGAQPALKMLWYDGGKLPPKPPSTGRTKWTWPTTASCFVGDKGTMVCGGWSGAPRLFPPKRRERISSSRRRPSRARIGHRAEWIQACKDEEARGRQGGLRLFRPVHRSAAGRQPRHASWKRIEWDAAALRAKNAPEADALIRKRYRAGFGIQA